MAAGCAGRVAAVRRSAERGAASRLRQWCRATDASEGLRHVEPRISRPLRVLPIAGAPAGAINAHSAKLIRAPISPKCVT